VVLDPDMHSRSMGPHAHAGVEPGAPSCWRCAQAGGGRAGAAPGGLHCVARGRGAKSGAREAGLEEHG